MLNFLDRVAFINSQSTDNLVEVLRMMSDRDESFFKGMTSTQKVIVLRAFRIFR